MVATQDRDDVCGRLLLPYRCMYAGRLTVVRRSGYRAHSGHPSTLEDAFPVCTRISRAQPLARIGAGAQLWILICSSSSSMRWTYQRWISSHIRCQPHRWTTVRAGQIVTAERVGAHLLAHAPKATSAGPTNARAALHLREDGRRPPRKMRSEKWAIWQIARNSQPLAGLASL